MSVVGGVVLWRDEELMGKAGVKPTTVTNFTTAPVTNPKTATTEVTISAVKLEARPDYPVAAGQTVSLLCSAAITPANISWTWKHLRYNIWHERGEGSELILTEPEQSGQYMCSLWSAGGQRGDSNRHTVYIISMQATVGEKLGIVAFIISLLTFIITFAILMWMLWQRFGQKVTASDTAAKSFTGRGTTSKGSLPETGIESDVYMNYTNSSQAYSNLDPNSMAEDNMYSSLS